MNSALPHASRDFDASETIEPETTAIAIATAAPNVTRAQIVFANETCCAFAEARRQDLVGRPPVALAGARADVAYLAALETAWTGRAAHARVRRVQKDGAVRETELSITPLFDGRGSIARYAIVERDVTEARGERTRAWEDRIAEARAHAIAELALGAAYEIENPLSVALANVESALARGERAGDALVHARDALLQLTTTVEGLRALAPQRRAQALTFALPDTVDAALALTADSIAARARLRRDDGEVPAVFGEPERLTRALALVLTNAVQAIPPGSAEHNEIVVKTRTRDDGWAVVEIADTGEGIDAAALPHVFEPFFTSRPRAVCTGLGLSIVRATVLSSGGRVAIASKPGLGTRVTVALPPAREDDDDDVTEVTLASEPRLVARR